MTSVLREGRSLVLEAPPGAGKTTRVPPALLPVVPGEIVVLEPRRLAARLAARRVAEELGEEVGRTVGYQVRHEDVSGPETRVRFVTEGLLGRRLLSAPTLPGVGAVVLDEFHERHIHGDLALALLRRLQATDRPDLRLVVMSATLEAEPVARFLGDCPRLRAEGRLHPVSIEYAPGPDELPLERQVSGAIRRLVQEGLDGDVLVFLPGAAEIARAQQACADVVARHDLVMVTLHGDLSPAEQDRAVRPAARPKVILSTNVAETSVTIEGVAAVVDSGLARVAGHSPWTGLPTLRLAKISQASAAQRAGRAGRTRPGRCLRLYTRHDHDGRPAHDAPEIRRLDLAETLLALHAAGVPGTAQLEWLDPPPAPAVEAAEGLLRRLGAVDGSGALTPVGRRMLRFPLHPRLARLLVEAEARGAADEGCRLAASLGERPGPGVERARRQLARLCERRPRAGDPEEAAAISVLAGFSDRVARRRRPGGKELLLSGGGTAELADETAVGDLLVVLDVEERRSAAGTRVLARQVAAIEPEWLLDAAPEAMRATTEVLWSAEAGRVEVLSRLAYDALVLEESRRPPGPGEAEEAARVLASAARAAGVRRFVDAEELDRWLARVAFAAAHGPVPALTDADLEAALADACAGATTFAEISGAAVLGALRARLGPDGERALSRLAPDRVTLAGGRSVRVEYERDKPPWIASRLQDFFGMAQGPTVAGGRVPLVLHLLAPNRRAVQVTTDLAGFWDRHYPAIRKELARKYPRHAWPERP